jgi:hypothetical protein
MTKYSKLVAVVGAIAISTSLSAGIALAHETGIEANHEIKAEVHVEKAHNKTMVGTVTSVSGNIIVFTAKKNTSMTADLTNAKISVRSGNVKLTVSQIMVGDRVEVRGAVTGNNVVATKVRDLSIRRLVMAGKVTAVNGSNITVDGRTNRTISASSTTTVSAKSGNVTLANVVVGAFIKAEGLLNKEGNVLTASSIRILVPKQ